jgi:hypothetical protein
MKAPLSCILNATLLFLTVIPSLFAAEVNLTCKNAVTDTATLNQGISASRAGDEIRIHGNCLINDTIILFGDRSYIGDSRTGTTITQASGSNLPAMLASDSWNCDTQKCYPTSTGDPIRIAHLTLNGNSQNNHNTNALVIRSWLTVIEDLQIEYAPGDGIQITNLNKNGVPLENTQVNGRISNVFVQYSGGNGIHIVDTGNGTTTGNSVTDWDLLDSWIGYSGQSAIYMDNAAGWKIRGNHLYGVKQHGIFANRCYATAIDGNYIEDFGDSGEGQTWYGIACTVQGGAASVITGNKVFMLQTEPSSGEFIYIAVPQVNYGTGEINIVNNTIRGAGTAADTGLLYQLSGGIGLNLLSSNNNVQSVQTARTIGPGVTLVTEY